MTQPERPSVMKMAASATKAAVEFAASGFKTATQEVHDARTAICGNCEHHEGTQCVVCGCYTDKKAWLPLEDCPLGKWPC